MYLNILQKNNISIMQYIIISLHVWNRSLPASKGTNLFFSSKNYSINLADCLYRAAMITARIRASNFRHQSLTVTRCHLPNGQV